MQDNILKIFHNNQALFFFGARHSNNPNDAQFSELKEFFEEFIKTSPGEKVVFTEGVMTKGFGSWEESINQRGEIGATQWLAHQEDISVVFPEPDLLIQHKILCESFDFADVAYALVAQNLAAWFKQTTRSRSFNEALINTLKRESSFASVYGFAPDEEWFLSYHGKLFPGQKLDDSQFLDGITDPRTSNTVVNEIIAKKSQIRNEAILKNIESEWLSGKSIFIAYGRGHLSVLKPKIEEIIGLSK